MSIQINFLGDIFLDIVSKNVISLPEWGTDTLSRISIHPGGSCLNSVVHGHTYLAYLQKSGDICNVPIHINIFSAVGNDVQGQTCLRFLHDSNISIENILLLDNDRTGTCVVISGPDDRCFITDRGCIDNLKLGLFSIDNILNCNHFHVSGYYNCNKIQDELPELFQTMSSKGITTSLNPQYDASEKWDKIDLLCPYLTCLIASKSEIQKISKLSNENDGCKRILSWGCQLVVMTLASEGSRAFQLKDERIIETHCNSFAVDIVDTTGAGDAFTAGFLIDWVRRKDINSALIAGNLCGAGAVTKLSGSASSSETLLDISLNASK